MVIIAEIIIMTKNIQNYDSIFGEGLAPARGYEIDGSSDQCGYVTSTAVPKHLGSIYL